MSNVTLLSSTEPTATVNIQRPTEGVLSLVLQARNGRTILQDCYAQAPLRLLRPVYPDESGTAYLYLLNPCGGIVGGDTYRIAVTIGASAQAFMTMQAATLLYAAPTKPARQQLTFTLEAGAVFTFMPAQTIPFAHAAFHQVTTVRLGPGATVVLGDILAPGRLAQGEAFAYRTYTARLQVEDSHGEVVLLDHTHLQPHQHDNTNLGLLEGSNYLGSLYALCEGTAFAPALVQTLQTLLAEWPGLAGGATLLACGGIAVRVLAADHTAARDALHMARDVLHHTLTTPVTAAHGP